MGDPDASWPDPPLHILAPRAPRGGIRCVQGAYGRAPLWHGGKGLDQCAMASCPAGLRLPEQSAPATVRWHAPAMPRAPSAPLCLPLRASRLLAQWRLALSSHDQCHMCARSPPRTQTWRVMVRRRPLATCPCSGRRRGTRPGARQCPGDPPLSAHPASMPRGRAGGLQPHSQCAGRTLTAGQRNIMSRGVTPYNWP